MSYGGQLCVDINEYAENLTAYPQRDSIVYIMGGTHLLYSKLVIQNTSNISLVGVGGYADRVLHRPAGPTLQYSEPLSRIQCASSVSGLEASNVDDVTIANITFSDCGSTNTSAIYLAAVQNIEIYGISLQNAHGFGVLQVNSDSMRITNSSFVNIDGTALVCSDSTFTAVVSTFFFNVSYGVATSYGAMEIESCFFVYCGCGVSLASSNAKLSLTGSAFSLSDVGISARAADGAPHPNTAQLILDHCDLDGMKTAGLALNNIATLVTHSTMNNSIVCIIGNNSVIQLNDIIFSDSMYGITADDSAIELALCRFNTVSWAVQATRSYLYFGQSSFVNYRLAGRFLYSYIVIEDSTFLSGSFVEGRESSVVASESYLVMSGNVSFLNGCSAGYGGAIHLSDTTIALKAPVIVSFTNNSAMFGGGAVYEEHQHAQSYCGFFRLLDPGGSFQNPFIHLRFQDNEAQETGDDVYASLDCAYKFDPSEIPYYYVHNRTNTDILRALASPSNIDIAADPLIVCYTYEGAPQQCSHNQTSPEQMTLYPGQSKMLIILTLDEYGGTTPSVVFFVDGDGQYYDTWRTGTSYSYPLGYELSNNISLRIIPQALFRVGMDSGIKVLRISVVVNPCPVGFSLNESGYTCVCNSFLHSLPSVTCEIKEVAIHKLRFSWIGYSSRGALSYYEQCPLDYCRDSHLVNLSDPDEQCNNDHSGTLCGGCKSGLSHVFGQSLCRECSNLYLLLLIPFAVMGVALVALIFCFNLTVSSGTINGFIFYANIVKINDALFQPLTDSNVFIKILSIFISWLNLDFGIVTCFYNGMDIYGKTALQFAFPAYILFIVCLTILAGRYSRRVSRLLSGQNMVPVIATLVLICYAKVFKTAIAILSYASVTVEGNNTTQDVEVVWRHNGNIRYGEVWHWPLILVAVAMIALFIIPYTLLLLLTPVLQTKSELKAFGWVKKLKPFIDSYEGPYVNRHRFWTGILLLARAIIYSVNTNVQLTSKSTDLMVVISITVGLMVYLARFGVYKKWQYTLLEMFLCADLSLLCLIALSFESYEESGSSALSLSSLHSAYAVLVGIAFICFLAVLGIQTYLFVKRLRTKQGAEHQPKQPQEYMMLDVISKPARSLEVSATEYEPRYLRESLMEASNINRSEHS